ncbi:hypothetical protein SAMN05428979_0857 [Stappia sp. ES.058]|nr:hypothetical protein SAMN05428979_0857 [Stappia sp. ES.058]
MRGECFGRRSPGIAHAARRRAAASVRGDWLGALLFNEMPQVARRVTRMWSARARRSSAVSHEARPRSGPVELTAMVGADVCGYEEQARRKAEAFQGIAIWYSVRIRPIRRTAELTSTCGVKALYRGNSPALWAFPCISRHLERHFSHSDRPILKKTDALATFRIGQSGFVPGGGRRTLGKGRGRPERSYHQPGRTVVGLRCAWPGSNRADASRRVLVFFSQPAYSRLMRVATHFSL